MFSRALKKAKRYSLELLTEGDWSRDAGTSVDVTGIMTDLRTQIMTPMGPDTLWKKIARDVLQRHYVESDFGQGAEVLPNFLRKLGTLGIRFFAFADMLKRNGFSRDADALQSAALYLVTNKAYDRFLLPPIVEASDGISIEVLVTHDNQWGNDAGDAALEYDVAAAMRSPVHTKDGPIARWIVLAKMLESTRRILPFVESDFTWHMDRYFRVLSTARVTLGELAEHFMVTLASRNLGVRLRDAQIRLSQMREYQTLLTRHDNMFIWDYDDDPAPVAASAKMDKMEVVPPRPLAPAGGSEGATAMDLTPRAARAVATSSVAAAGGSGARMDVVQPAKPPTRSILALLRAALPGVDVDSQHAEAVVDGFTDDEYDAFLHVNPATLKGYGFNGPQITRILRYLQKLKPTEDA
jgi:hypothetical protein